MISWRREWTWGLLLVVAVLIAFGPTLLAGFVWDDDIYVTKDALLTSPGGLWKMWFSLDTPSQYFPLTYTALYVEHALWGLNPAGYHLVNILLHAVNALLVWRVLTRLRIPGALLAAGIFALHPVTVESVAWVSELKNVLMCLFFMLSILAWIDFVERPGKTRWLYYALSLVFCALSLFAKTTACTLPAALLLILWMKKVPIDWRRLAQVLPHLVMGVCLGLISMWWEKHHQGSYGKAFHIPWAERFLIASHALWFYAGKVFWPAHLTVNYRLWNVSASSPACYIWPAATALMAALIWWIRRWSGRGLETGVLFFAATLAPMLGFFMLYTFVYSYVADHYQYVACIGLIALAAAGIELVLGRIPGKAQVVRIVVYNILLLTLGTLTFLQCGIYASEETLWSATLRENRDSWLALGNLGAELSKDGQMDAAISDYRRALDLNPNFLGINYDMGVCYFSMGRLDDAIQAYRRELQLDPSNDIAHNNIGKALEQQGHWNEAVAEYQTALAIDPNSGAANDNLGMALLKLGRLDDAIAHLQKAVEIEPAFVGEQDCLGLAYAKKGRQPDAINHFENAVATNADNIEAGDHLSWLLATAPDASVRDGARALTLAQHAAELSGNENPTNLESLAAADAETGNFKDAAAVAERGLDLAVKQNNKPLAEALRAEMKLYLSGKPARDSAAHWNLF
jgi:tetratricopeptide (TPR) repeat protein